ncbi:hypothetical protein Tco_0708839 [Tanacetum coccineum]
MDDLTSEGHDLLSSRVILSDDDFRRGCELPSDLESGFYKDNDKLISSYSWKIERLDIEGPFAAEGRRISEGGHDFLMSMRPPRLLRIAWDSPFGYWKVSAHSSDLESGFYKDNDKLNSSYNWKIERLDIEGPFAAEGRRISEGGVTSLVNTPLTYRASTSANPDPMISLAFVEANYEVLESLLRERRRRIRNGDLRIELEYFSEEYDEERKMEPRPTRARETTPVLRTKSLRFEIEERRNLEEFKKSYQNGE